MSILQTLKDRFRPALTSLVGNGDVEKALELIRPAQDARFGDYQANMAMSLGKQLGRPPREIATEIIASLKLDDLCHPPEVAGPGFINLRIRDDGLAALLQSAAVDDRLGVTAAS
ncbi:MAG: arginine--tRNA ligase, partial [Patescibacteria group bacterium]|nr:arginine--tRNA ligase [Patescibacteria group bacterium]